MKRIINIIFIICLVQFTVNGQSAITEKTLIGKWSICFSSKFDKNHKCDSIVKYEFTENGIYIEYRKTVCDYIHYDNVNGTWTLKNNNLVMTEEWCASTRNIEENIIWINNNTFYTIGREGKHDPKVYTYYTRVK